MLPGGQSEHGKAMLRTPAGQIAKLKSLGVAFDACDEDEAAAYLADKTYFFKVIAYCELLAAVGRREAG